MPLRTMALARATEQVGRFAGAGPGECLALRSAGAHDRETFVPVMARSLVVCAGAWLPELLEPALAAPFRVYRQTLLWFDSGDAAIARRTKG